MDDNRTNIPVGDDSFACNTCDNITSKSRSSEENSQKSIKDRITDFSQQFDSIREKLRSFGIDETKINDESFECAGEFLRLRRIKQAIITSINEILR